MGNKEIVTRGVGKKCGREGRVPLPGTDQIGKKTRKDLEGVNNEEKLKIRKVLQSSPTYR